MAPPPLTPRTPHPTPTIPSRYVGGNSSSSSGTSTGTSSSSSSSSSSDYSYFSASAPHISSSNPDNNTRSTFTAPVPHAHHQLHTTDFTKPIITCSVTTNTNAFAPAALHHLQYHHTHPPPAPSDALRQFALHIPSPPQLTLPPKSSGRQQAPSPSSASDTQCQNQPLQSPQSRYSESNPQMLSPQAPDMTCCTDPSQYLLVVPRLPSTITSDMVTISANKGDRLRVNAQAWGGENAALFEWQISFPPQDVDLSRVQAKFDSGCLTIRVPRWSKGLW